MNLNAFSMTQASENTVNDPNRYKKHLSMCGDSGAGSALWKCSKPETKFPTPIRRGQRRGASDAGYSTPTPAMEDNTHFNNFNVCILKCFDDDIEPDVYRHSQMCSLYTLQISSYAKSNILIISRSHLYLYIKDTIFAEIGHLRYIICGLCILIYVGWIQSTLLSPSWKMIYSLHNRRLQYGDPSPIAW